MKRKRSGLLWPVLLLLSLFVWLPLLFVAGNSFMNAIELNKNLAPVLTGTTGFASGQVFPQYLTLSSYVALLMDRPEFYHLFFNSSIISIGTLMGQFLAAVPAAWWFARSKKEGKGKGLLLLYTILMIMPFQVTMLSSYFVLSSLKLLDTLWCIVLPLIFSTFPIIIMVESFASIPESTIEAARVDGAGSFKIFFKIGVPGAKGGIVAAMTLMFLESWNLIEQPLAFLKNQANWPLSLFLPNVKAADAGLAFAVAIMTLLPPLLIFLYGQNSLEAGAGSVQKEGLL